MDYYIIELIYDASRTAPVVILQHKKTLEKIQVIISTGLNLLDSAEILESKYLQDIEIGSYIYHIEEPHTKFPKYIRSAGTVGQFIQKTTIKHGYGLIKLPSQKLRYFSLSCKAKLGTISNSIHKYKHLKKAGQSR